MAGNRNTAIAQAHRAQALQLRMGGASYSEIAAQMGSSSAATAFKQVRAALREMLQEPADAVREMELARYDRLMAAHWPAALRGDIQASAMVLRIMERRAALLGLDAPKKIDLTAYIRDLAEREGIDPDEAVAAAQEIVRAMQW